MATRTSFFEQNLKTPRGQLDNLWWKTMSYGMLDEKKYDLHEAAAELKERADSQHGTTGVYPDGEVQKFLAKLS